MTSEGRSSKNPSELFEILRTDDADLRGSGIEISIRENQRHRRHLRSLFDQRRRRVSVSPQIMNRYPSANISGICVPCWAPGMSDGDLDTRRVTAYFFRVIKTFADRRTQELYMTGQSKRFPPEIANRAKRKLEYVDLAVSLDDLKVPPGNKLHRLERERKGQYAIAVNDQWRICFRFVDGDAFDVEITDYH